MGLTITGLGTAIPEQRLTNADLERMVDTSDAWIVERTGIRERRVAAPDETSATLGTDAAAAALKDAGLTPGDIGLLVVATTTPVQLFPSTAVRIQDSLGLRCGAFDVMAACSGFVYGLVTAAGMMTVHAGLPAASGGQSGGRPSLVVGTETLTRVVDPNDRSTRILFGDGAGAAVVDHSVEPDGGLLSWDLGSDGSLVSLLEVPPGEPWLRMEGKEVFRRAVRVVVESSATVLQKAGMTPEDVDLFVPHQANVRIIDAVCSRIGIPLDRTVVNIDRYGNTSAASIPLALAEAAEQGRLTGGEVVLVSGFGAGMTWASAVLRWEPRP
ncbi:MAG: ketoacyl-ACP synthase III [Actinomycetota bacterium]|nr:ketoacyl-ACP synthase III [Actinomycetota bacterium]